MSVQIGQIKEQRYDVTEKEKNQEKGSNLTGKSNVPVILVARDWWLVIMWLIHVVSCVLVYTNIIN